MKKICLFWLSLASTSFFMALELPICTAAISRFSDPELNLASIGIISSIALFVQSPVLRIMSLPLIMIRDKVSFYQVRRFVVVYCIIVSLIFLCIASNPLFNLVLKPVLNLNPDIAKSVQSGLFIWCVYPIIIGLRRFYHGLLLCAHEPKKIAIATFFRLGFLISLISFFSYFKFFSGVISGVLSLGIGMFAELVISRFFAKNQINKFLNTDEEKNGEPLTFYNIFANFIPLSISSTVAMSTGPLLSFFTTKGVMPIESLILSPVIFGLLQPFSWTAFAIQDVAHTFILKGGDAKFLVKKFTFYLGLFLSTILIVVSVTPLSGFYFLTINKISLDLYKLTYVPMLIISFIPIVYTLKNFYRGNLIACGKIKTLFLSECFEIICLTSIFSLLIIFTNLPSIYDVFISLMAAGCLNLLFLKLQDLIPQPQKI